MAQKKSLTSNISDWQEVPIDDWQEVGGGLQLSSNGGMQPNGQAQPQEPTFLQRAFAPNKQSYGEIFGQGEKTFQQGKEFERGGDNFSAYAKAATSAAQTVMSPFAAADKFLMDSGDPMATSIGVGLRTANIPVQAFSDVVGHGVDKVAGFFGASPQQREALKETGETYAPFALPTFLKGGAKLTGATARGIGLPKLATALETKAIQPPFDPKKGLETFRRPAKTALEYNLGPNPKSYSKLSFGLEKLDNEARSVASTSQATVDLNRMNTVIDTELSSLKNSALKPEATAALEDMRSRINSVADQYPNRVVPLSAAIELKRSIQQIASGKYDEVATPKAESAKILAHELLDDIIQKEPSLKENGLKQRELIQLQGVLGRRVAQLSKRPVVSWRNARALGLGVGVGVGSGNPALGAGAAAIEMALDNPMIQHRTAVFLDRISGGKKKRP